MKIEQILETIEQDTPTYFFSLFSSLDLSLSASDRDMILKKAEEQWGPEDGMIKKLRGNADQKVPETPSIPADQVIVLNHILGTRPSNAKIRRGIYREQSVAVKPVEIQLNEESQEGLENEAYLLNKARSKYVIGCWGMIREKMNARLILQYGNGGDLSKTLYSSELSISPIQKLGLAWKVCGAVSYVHSLGILHLDIKSANFVLADNQIKLIDFAGSTTEDGHIAEYNVGLGTRLWRGPEGFIPQFAFDIFSLGVVLFEILTQKLPKMADGKSIAEHVSLRREIPFPGNTPLVFKYAILACTLPAIQRPSAYWLWKQFNWALKAVESIPPSVNNKNVLIEHAPKMEEKFLPQDLIGRLLPVLGFLLLNFLTLSEAFLVHETNKFNWNQQAKILPTLTSKPGQIKSGHFLKLVQFKNYRTQFLLLFYLDKEVVPKLISDLSNQERGRNIRSLSQSIGTLVKRYGLNSEHLFGQLNLKARAKWSSVTLPPPPWVSLSSSND